MVIIAIVVVISLVVVGLLNGLAGNSDTAKTAKKIGAYSSGISVSDAAMDASGDAVFVVRSNQGSDLTLSSVTVNGTPVTNTSQISQVDDSSVKVSGVLNSCCLPGETGLKDCKVVFNYSTPNLSNLSTPVTVTVECVSDVVVNQVTPSPACLASGSGTLADPKKICTCDDLQNIKLDLDANYILAQDIDCLSFANINDGNGFEPLGKKYCVGHPEITNQADCEGYGNCIHSQCPGEGWCSGSGGYYEYVCENCTYYGCSPPVGVWNPLGLVWVEEPFVGSFDGNNNKITNLKINRPTESYIGLFGYMKANISDLELVDENIIGNECVGGIVGDYYNATLSNVSLSGVVTGLSSYPGKVGGMGGCLTNSKILNSNSTAAVFGNSGVGGLVGQQTDSNINNSYSLGNVTSENGQIGGLVGLLSSGTISGSYSSGTISSNGSSVGGLVGTASAGLIIDSNNYGPVRGNSNVGGLVGSNSVDVNMSINFGTILGTGSKVGGVVGDLSSGRIFRSGSNGTVSGGSQVGGLVGVVSEYRTILESFSTGDVNGSGTVGGLIGEIPQHNGGSVISKSYSAGDVNGGSNVGGFVGYVGYAYSTSNTISKSFALGNVYGDSSVGGFIGGAGSVVTTDSYCRGNVTRRSGTSGDIAGLIGTNWMNSSIYSSYSTGSVIYLGATNPTNRGFSGSGSASIPLPAQRNCFWDMTTSGQSSNIYYPFMALGKTTAQMKTLSTYSGASWDIATNSTVMNNGYPFLGWQIGNSTNTWLIN